MDVLARFCRLNTPMKTVPTEYSEYSSTKPLSITNGLETCEGVTCELDIPTLKFESWEACGTVALGKKFSSHIAHMPSVCCAASSLLAPFSNRHLLDPVRSRFRSLIKALEQTRHGTANVQVRKKTPLFCLSEVPMLMFAQISSLHVESSL